MQLNEYAEEAMKYDMPHHNIDEGILNAAMGLCGESGEFIDLLKKCHFHGHPIEQEHMIKELGDVLWYIAQACKYLNVSLEDVAETNLLKLLARYPEQHFSSERSINRKLEDI